MKTMKHEKSYKGLPNGAGQIVCSCGYETPSVDDSQAFTLGRKQKSVEAYFLEHITDMRQQSGVETTMLNVGSEKAVTPAQHAAPRKRKA